jgi:hypothetical protein
MLCYWPLHLQLYVPRIPGMPDYDDALVPEKWDFQGEVSWVVSDTYLGALLWRVAGGGRFWGGGCLGSCVWGGGGG